MSVRPVLILRLLGLALALLTTGCLLLGSSVSGDTKTDTAQTPLSPSEPVYRHRVKLYVGPKKRSDSVRVYDASLSIELSAIRWKPPTGQGAPVLPWFRVRILDEADGRLVHEQTYVFEDPRGADTLHRGGGTYYMDVTPRDSPPRFEATYLIEFERQGPPSEGPIDVTWRLGASGMAHGGEHLLVSLSYP
ncbi:hypothetical protein MYSTI_02083 [Myxococcus stipitatus DSM 14675]|uniref:Lipoprotein n=1 Tax=Myxococcus stipitatus (strain DSM 14675 / JCM 12634 / Mx s8) TaxID=1278073 RepID=L7U770_MYXSD|nr:hypothetical protein [Myxococcus stipitatus]AGC43412.1 hypothetical protein MYSTI_02083 [Myxococcus stipitatus DSM 14675]